MLVVTWGLFFCCLFQLWVSDFLYCLVPQFLLSLLFCLGMFLGALYGLHWGQILGALLIVFLGELFPTDTMGSADLWIMATFLCLFGWVGVYYAVLLAVVLALLVSSIVCGLGLFRARIPFIPFLIVGGLCVGVPLFYWN